MRARTSIRRLLGAALALVTCVAGAFACGASDEGSTTFPNPDAAADAPLLDSGVGGPFAANGVVIVHAASLPAFRLCFEAQTSLPPLPSDQLMPDSNIVGVDVGRAVRLDPISLASGRVWAFEEPALRTYYPPGVEGPSCLTILRDLPNDAHDLGTIDRDLSTGVHLLVVTGCRNTSADAAASKERCGDTWNATTGNLSLDVVPLRAFGRPMPSSLPIQIVQLSRGVANRARDRSMTIAFGALDASPPSVISEELGFGKVVPETPTPVAYDPSDTSAYGTMGFHLSFKAATNAMDAGGTLEPSEPLLRQSLADVGRLSSSRAVPPEWFATASSYVLLLLGDPDLDAGDAAGPNDREQLHLLAVPVAVTEEPDGGADGRLRRK